MRANLYDLLRLLRDSWVALAGFVLLILTGAFYINGAYGVGYAAGVYEALKLLTLQSGLELPGDWLGRLLFFLIPLLGLALVLDSVFRFGRLLLDKSTRREAWQEALASTFQRHVIVCGLGRVGLRAVNQLLDAGAEVVVVELDWGSEFVKQALELKVPVVRGDARELSTLRLAGLERAQSLLVCINDDLTNIEVGLTARAVQPDLRVILRVFNDELDHNLERAFGAHSVFSASALAAPTFAAATVSRAAEFVLPLGGQALGVTRLLVQANSQLDGFTRQIEETHGLRVLQHTAAGGRSARRESLRQISAGDYVTLIGPLAALESLHSANQPGGKLAFLSGSPAPKGAKPSNRVLVCGLGKTGYRTVHELHALNPRPQIVVVHIGGTRGEFLRDIQRLEGVQVVIGDARNKEVLHEAGIHEAYSVAALSSDDLTNLQICLMARRMCPDIHLVLRMFSDVLAEQLGELFGIRTAYSTSALAAPTMAAAALLGDVTHAFFAGGHLFSADQIIVQNGDPICASSVEEVRTRFGALVLSIARNGNSALMPGLSERIEPGDDVTVLAASEALALLRAGMLQALARRGRDAAVVKSVIQ